MAFLWIGVTRFAWLDHLIETFYLDWVHHLYIMADPGGSGGLTPPQRVFVLLVCLKIPI